MASNEFEVLKGLLKKYVSDEEYNTIMGGDPMAISRLSPSAQAKYNAYRALCESLDLCDNEEFNRLVESKAAAYRKEYMSKFDRDKYLEGPSKVWL